MKIKISNPVKFKKYIMLGIAGLLSIVIVYIAFSPKDDINNGQENFMTDIPDPDTIPLERNKSKVYEDQESEAMLRQQMQYLDDVLEVSTADDSPEYNPQNIPIITNDKLRAQDEHKRSIEEANKVLMSVNSDLSTKSESSTPSSKEVELTEKLIEAETKQKLLEAEMAASKVQMQILANSETMEKETQNPKMPEAQSEEPVSPVQQIQNETVSTTLRRQGFRGVDFQQDNKKNTIAAITYGRQVVSDGQYVKFRLMEPMQIGSLILPKGSMLVGVASVATDRLFVRISNIEFKEIIASVSIEVYDIDGQRGLFIPGSLEMDAAKDIGSSVATSLASSATNGISIVSNTPTASEQLKTEVGRGIIQGTASYVGRKLQQIKVTVQDYHKVFLVPTSQIN